MFVRSNPVGSLSRFVCGKQRFPLQVESKRMLNYHQRMRNSGRGKNWERWYNEFKSVDPYYIDDPTHIKWFPKELRKPERELEAKVYQRLFSSKSEEMNFSRACNIVDTIRLDHGITPQSWMYAGVLYHIGSTKDVYYMSYFWKQLTQNKAVKLEANAYNAIVKSFAQNVDIEGAQYVIEEMKEADLEVNANTYNALCSFDRPNLYYMEAIMETLEDKKIKPNTDTYTLMIDTYTRELDFKNANKMFSAIKENECIPHIYAYEALMRSRCKAEFPNEAREVIEHLHSDKPDGVVPLTSTYNVLLDYFESHGKDTEADEIMKLMKERGVLYDTHSYNALLRAKYNAGKASMALKIFEKWNFRRDEATFAIAIDSAVQAGQYDTAVTLHERAKNRGYVYNEKTAMPTYYEPIPLVYPRRCDYWEICGDHHMTLDRAISFDKV